MVMVYAFDTIDTATGEMSPSKCLATQDYIVRHGGTAIEGTGIDVAASQLDAQGRHFPDEAMTDATGASA